MKKRERGDDIRMDIKNIDRSLMMIFLLEKCNYSCDHCVRQDEPMYPGYKLTSEQLKTCLSDCHNLQTVEWVHFSGGEPTLWSEENLDLIDLLKEISKEGFEPGFTTNGSNFTDYKRCYDFFKRYIRASDKRLRLYISIDTFHHNFDVERGRARSLDNVLKFKMDIPLEKRELLKIIVIVTVSKDVKSLLPEEMIEHYKSLGVEFNFTPLRLQGKARSMGHLCPDMESRKKQDLGAYYPFHQQKKGQDAKFNLILIGNDYYFHDPWRKVGILGQLPKKIMELYLRENKGNGKGGRSK